LIPETDLDLCWNWNWRFFYFLACKYHAESKSCNPSSCFIFIIR